MSLAQKEVLLLILSECSLLVIKYRVQLQRKGLIPRSLSSLDGITVLKVELKSMNSILTKILFLSK